MVEKRKKLPWANHETAAVYRCMKDLSKPDFLWHVLQLIHGSLTETAGSYLALSLVDEMKRRAKADQKSGRLKVNLGLVDWGGIAYELISGLNWAETFWFPEVNLEQIPKINGTKQVGGESRESTAQIWIAQLGTQQRETAIRQLVRIGAPTGPPLIWVASEFFASGSDAEACRAAVRTLRLLGQAVIDSFLQLLDENPYLADHDEKAIRQVIHFLWKTGLAEPEMLLPLVPSA